MIITYYAVFQKNIRLLKMVKSDGDKKQGIHSNDPAYFEKVNGIDDNRESIYDGFYAVHTDLVDETVSGILKVSEGHWKNKAAFRIMTTDFNAQPVCLSRKDRISAHFLISFLALMILRLLQKKIGEGYTTNQIIDTLREYNLLKINGEGYIPEYTRAQLTDMLHHTFGFRTDTEIIPAKKINSIIAGTKNNSTIQKQKRKKS